MALRWDKTQSSVVTNNFKELSKTAQSLNAVTDKLNAVIEKLDNALRALNLGVVAWVKFDGYSDNDMGFEYDSVGFDKNDSQWGLMVKHVEGNENFIEETKVTKWSYANAPRDLRMRAVKHIPELIQELNKVASKFATELVESMSEADELANAIQAAADGPKFELKINQVSTEAK